MITQLHAELPLAVLAELRRHCEEQYPNEACGAIFGHGDGATSPWRVTSVSRAPNEHQDDQRRRYLVPPEFQLRAEKEARASQQDVLGYYHSHPDHPAVPSEYDRAHAWLGYLYVICSVQKGRSTDVFGYTLDEQDGKFVEVAMRSGGESSGTGSSRSGSSQSGSFGSGSSGDATEV